MTNIQTFHGHTLSQKATFNRKDLFEQLQSGGSLKITSIDCSTTGVPKISTCNKLFFKNGKLSKILGI